MDWQTSFTDTVLGGFQGRCANLTRFGYRRFVISSLNETTEFACLLNKAILLCGCCLFFP